MKKIFLLLILLASSVYLMNAMDGDGSSLNPFRGILSSPEIWSTEEFTGDTVYIGIPTEPDLTVTTNGHLTIGPGITVIFTQLNSDLIITGSGILTAEGTSTDKITFTKASDKSHWGHITFETPGSGTPITGTGTFEYCTVQYGYAATSGTNPDNAGGGIQINANDVTVINCLIENNYSNFGGGITVNAGRNTIIRKTIFRSNNVNEAGGGLLLWTGSTALVENCIFEDNYSKGTLSASYSGGAIWLLSNTSKIVNCTFVENTSDRAGDGIYSYSSSNARIINSILWGSSDQFAGSSSTSTIVTCAFETAKPALAANSIIISDVAEDHFVNAGLSDWTLKFISPCRDAGVNSYTGVTIPTTDYLGNPTVYTKDIGAFEVQYSRWKTTASSTTWNTEGNWDGGIPTNTRDVIIPVGATNYPTGSPTQDFTIGSGRLMIIERSAKVTLANLTNNGSLKLKSDASGISSLILDSYSGNAAEAELYLTGGPVGDGNRWHLISSPFMTLDTTYFSTTKDLAQWIENYDRASLSEGWVAKDGWDYAIQAITGPGFNNLALGKGYTHYYVSNHTYNIAGELNTEDKSVNIYCTKPGPPLIYGHNLLGNPFSSGLNWDAIVIDVSYPDSTSKVLHYRKDGGHVYYINGVGSDEGVNGIIPPMQGFFVKAYGKSRSITLPANARVHDNIPARYKGKESTLIPLIRLKIMTGDLYDNTVVRFDENAKPGLDFDFDAVKDFISETKSSIYTVSEGTKFVINGLPYPEPDVAKEIPVVVNLTSTGNHNIMASQLQALDDYDVYLVDNNTGSTTDLKSNPIVTFSASSGLITDRFILKIINITTGTENPFVTKNNFNIYYGFDLINIQTIADEWDGKTGSVRVVDISGKTVADLRSTEFNKSAVTQVKAPDANGIYFIEIRSGVKRYVGKVVIK